MYTEAIQTGVVLVSMVIQHTQLNISKHTRAADLKQQQIPIKISRNISKQTKHSKPAIKIWSQQIMVCEYVEGSNTAFFFAQNVNAESLTLVFP